MQLRKLLRRGPEARRSESRLSRVQTGEKQQTETIVEDWPKPRAARKRAKRWKEKKKSDVLSVLPLWVGVLEFAHRPAALPPTALGDKNALSQQEQSA